MEIEEIGTLFLIIGGIVFSIFLGRGCESEIKLQKSKANLYNSCADYLKKNDMDKEKSEAISKAMVLLEEIKGK
jgi:hypothetical protein